MAYWLMKSEPESYSLEDLERDGSTDEARWFPLSALPNRRVELVDVALRMAGTDRPGESR